MEQILDFNIPLNLQLLDQILEQQQKYNDLLNKFINHELVWTKVNQLLKSDSNRIKFFGLTVLESSVIKKKLLNQLNQDQKQSIVNELLQITLNYSSSDSNTLIVKKKSASLISQIICKEWSNSSGSNESFQLTQTYITQLLKCISDPSSYQLDQIYGVMMVFSNLCNYVKQEIDSGSSVDAAGVFKNIQQVFDMVFTNSFQLFDFMEKSKSNIQQQQQQKSVYDELIKEILKTISSLFDLVSIEYCFRSDLILFLVNKMGECVGSGSGSSSIQQQQQLKSYVLTLSEHINVLVSKVMQQASQTGQVNPKINEIISSIFKSIVLTCSKSIPEKIKSSNMLLENITTLFTTYLKNFLLVLETIDTESTLFCEKFLINILSFLPVDRLTLVLEYFGQLFKGFLVNGDNQKIRLELHAPFIPLYFTSILSILENHDQDEDNELKGILFTSIQDGGDNLLLDKNEEEEDWKKVETLLSESLESIGVICFNDAFDLFTSKLFNLLGNNTGGSGGDEKHKVNSIFWCLGYLCKLVINFDIINILIAKLIDNNTLSSLDQDKRFNMISGLLFFIGHSTKYLEFQQNSPFIKSILEIITSQLLPSKSQSLVQISIITLDTIINVRKQFITFDSPNLDITLNQFIQNSNNNLSTNQIEMIYKCIGLFIYNFNKYNQSQYNNNSLNQILTPLVNSLKSNDNYQDKFIQWSSNVNNNLKYNISLAKSMKQLFNVQMSQLYPILIELFKWSNQEHQPIEKYSGSQISIKKNIIELLTVYIDNQSMDGGGGGANSELQNTLLLFLDVLCQDPTRNSQIYIVDVLPKTVLFISTVISTFKVNLIPQISKVLLDTFYKFSLEQAFNQSKNSRGLILLSNIWNLINSIQLFNSNLLSSDINNIYFELINKCLDNISPAVNGSALDSLIKYFTNIRSTPQLYDFNILVYQYIKILNLFYNSEYQTSLDKIIKLLFIIIQLASNDSNSKSQLMTLLEQKYKSFNNNNNINSKIQQLFNNINTLESFENNIKLIYNK